MRLLGLFDDRNDERSPESVASLPKLGRVADLLEFARQTRVDLVIVNRFGKQEASGEGLRQEIAGALLAGLPLLIAVRRDVPIANARVRASNFCLSMDPFPLFSGSRLCIGKRTSRTGSRLPGTDTLSSYGESQGM